MIQTFVTNSGGDPTKQSPDSTRDRLLDEAEKLFAERGFHGVTIREVTAAAGVNLAAVNYHFGSKENLYREVFRSRLVPQVLTVWKPLEDLTSPQPLTPEDLTAHAARLVLDNPLSEAERLRQTKLLLRERLAPTGALDIVSQEALTPVFRRLHNLLVRALPAEEDPLKIRLHTLSLFFLVVHFHAAQDVISKVLGRPYDREMVDDLVAYLTDFIVHGLSGRRGEANP